MTTYALPAQAAAVPAVMPGARRIGGQLPGMPGGRPVYGCVPVRGRTATTTAFGDLPGPRTWSPPV